MGKKMFALFIFIEIIFIACMLWSISYISIQKKIFSPPKPSQALNLTVEKMKWKIYMKQVGTKKAYADFKKIYTNYNPFIKQHLSLHFMGELLYEFDRMEGINTCDDSFSYACYHGFFGEAIQDVGIEEIKKMEKICVEKTNPAHSSCAHGIGHGILTSLGKESIAKALEICDTFSSKANIQGCYDGIFMEYSMSSHNGSLTIRPLDDSPYTPCSSLPTKYQNRCYFFNPFWWEEVYHHDFTILGDLCEELTDSNKENCYLGVGTISVLSANFDISKTLEKCSKVSSTKGNALCKAGAAIRYKINSEVSEFKNIQTNIICESRTSLTENLCVEKSRTKDLYLDK